MIPLLPHELEPVWRITQRPRNPIKELSKYAGQKRCATMRQDGDDLNNRSAKGRVQETKLLSNVWYLPRSSATDGTERSGHPATFPLELARRHILTWTNEGDKVLDPFVGSGTTCIAARDLGRHSIGIDISEDYIALSRKRLGL